MYMHPLEQAAINVMHATDGSGLKVMLTSRPFDESSVLEALRHLSRGLQPDAAFLSLDGNHTAARIAGARNVALLATLYAEILAAA
jgi:hypothetical protein